MASLARHLKLTPILTRALGVPEEARQGRMLLAPGGRTAHCRPEEGRPVTEPPWPSSALAFSLYKKERTQGLAERKNNGVCSCSPCSLRDLSQVTQPVPLPKVYRVDWA